MKCEVTIKARGPVACGKSRAIILLRETLEKNGFTIIWKATKEHDLVAFKISTSEVASQAQPGKSCVKPQGSDLRE